MKKTSWIITMELNKIEIESWSQITKNMWILKWNILKIYWILWVLCKTVSYIKLNFHLTVNQLMSDTNLLCSVG